jgi:hypothetical protein
MKPKKRLPRVQLAPEDIHLAFGDVRDHAAMAASIAVDAAADRKWFRAHPKANERQRPISEREVRATGRPPGTIVVVRRGPLGSQIRVFTTGQGQTN